MTQATSHSHHHHHQTQNQQRPLRHDEQEDETFYDKRRRRLGLDVENEEEDEKTKARARKHPSNQKLQQQQQQQQHKNASDDDKHDHHHHHHDSEDEDEEEEEDLKKMRLQFPSPHVKLYGREKELDQLQTIYHRMISNASAQVVFLPGYSGSGKSSLVQEFVRRQQQQQQPPLPPPPPPPPPLPQLSVAQSQQQPTTAIRPWLVSGKYEELNRGNNPYSAIAQGFSHLFLSLVQKIVEEKGDDHDDEKNDEDARQQSSSSLEWMNQIGIDDWKVLSEVIPGLSKLVVQQQQQQQRRLHQNQNQQQQEQHEQPTAKTTTTTTTTSTKRAPLNDVMDKNSGTTTTTTTTTTVVVGVGHNQLKLAFGKLVTALCTKDHPLIFFLDDLQWADDASINLLESLLLSSSFSSTKAASSNHNNNNNNNNNNHHRPLQYFLFLGAYRSNEVHSDHVLWTGLLTELQDQTKKQLILQQKEEEQPSPPTPPPPPQDQEAVRTSSNSSSNICCCGSIMIATTMEVTDLTKDDTEQFVADTLQRSAEEVRPLVQSIYNKTLGNIFFTMQGLEELVRKNGLYYDVMIFQWEWNITKIEVEQLLSDDVVDMVRSKMEQLPKLLQQILTIASLTKSTMTVDLLWNLLQGTNTTTTTITTSTVVTQAELVQMLELGVKEGLLQPVVATTTANNNNYHSAHDMTTSQQQQQQQQSDGGAPEYQFAHDRIQEAASGFVTDDARDQLCFQIATVLVKRMDESIIIPEPKFQGSRAGHSRSGGDTGVMGDDWMLFTAAHHFNSIPFRYILEAHSGSAHKAQTFLAQLNLRVGKLAKGKSAFPMAVELLRAGEACLRENGITSDKIANHHQWRDNYELCLDLFRHKMETEFALGHHEKAQQAVHQILNHAQTAEDRSWAEFYDIELIVCQKERNLTLGVERGLEYLKRHGFDIPLHPGPVQLLKEKMRLQRVQGRRKLIDLMDSSKTPLMEEPRQRVMRLLEQLMQCAFYSNLPLCVIVSSIGQRLSFEHGMSRHLPIVVSMQAFLHRQAGRFEAAYEFAAPGYEMLNRFSEGSSWVRAINTYCGCLLSLKKSVRYSIDPLYEAHRVGIACGDVEWASTSAMQYTLCYYFAGLPTNALFESKLLLFEEEARRYCQPPSMIVTFCIFRQALLNLSGKGNPNPTRLDGKAMKEKEVLAQFEGRTYQQTLRDISIFRLLLACVFGDDTVSKEMVDRLSTYPEFDAPVARQHLRDMLVGLTAFDLGRRQKNRKYTLLGQLKLKYFRKLAKTGSETASAIVQCLRAEENPSVKRYTAAIEACSETSFLHFEAIMSERCGSYCLATTQDQQLAKTHFTRALWSYYDWGAMGKVSQLRQTYHFLNGAQRLRSHSSVFSKYMSGHLTMDDRTRSSLSIAS
jgi:predicted ATPase